MIHARAISALLLATIVGAAWADDGLADARARIEKYRKGPLVVRVVDADGKPIVGATVKVRQTRSAVAFGCNMFMWDLCGEREELYRSRFKTLFDMATLPFYWWYYEPKEGETKVERLAAMAEWCRDNDITPKGHPLFWNHSEQDWLPSEPEQLKRMTLEHVEKIAKQYGDKIKVWDAVNEATNFERKRGSAPKLTGMWERVGRIELTKEAFAAARRGSPGASLLINDYDTSEQYEKLIEGLRESDGTCPFDIIGIQSHMHQGAWPTEKIRDVCQRFSRFGVPLHFTEVTVLSGKPGWNLKPWPSTPEGEASQAREVERVYAELFAQPAVEAIIWWDLADRGAWMKAPAGLLREDLSPKPAYEVLERLITREWRTPAIEAKTDAKGIVRNRVFHGEYEVTVRDGGQVRRRDVSVRKDAGEEPVLFRLSASGGEPNSGDE